MTLMEMLPALQSLPRGDKLRLMQWLATDLAREEGVTPLPVGQPYSVWPPYGAFDAAAALLDALAKDQASQH